MSADRMKANELRDSFVQRFSRLFDNDPSAVGKRLADEIIESDAQFRRAKEHVDAELARGGRSGKRRFRL